MSTAAATPPTPAEGAKKTDELDPTIKALFDTVEGEASQPTSDNSKPTPPGRSLTDAISPDDEDEKAKKEKEEADKKKAEDDKKAEEEAKKKKEEASAEPPPKTIKVRRRAADPTPTPAPAAATTTPAAKEPTADEKFEEGLLPEEKEQLALARYAESKFGDRYKGLAEKTLKFLKAHAAKLEEKDLDIESEAYKDWLAKNAVRLSPKEVREIEREQDRDLIRKENDAAIATQSDETFQQIEEPKVVAQGNAFYADAATNAGPEELIKAIREEGSEKAKEKFPVEYHVTNQLTNVAASDMEELVRLTKVNPRTGRTLKAYDPKNEQHNRVLTLVNTVCDDFAKTGGKATVNSEGKKFMSRESYYKLPKEQRAPFWTFSIEDVMKRSVGLLKRGIADRIAQEHKRLEGLGYVRKTAAAPSTSPAQPAAGAPAAPRSAPINPDSGTAPADGGLDKSLKSLYGE